MNVGGIDTNMALYAAKSGNMGNIGVKMLSKALDEQEIQADGLNKLMSAAEMERSVNPNIGSSFDMRV